MRLVPFTDTSAILRQSRFGRRAMFADWLPKDLADALWENPERLLAGAKVLQQRGVRRTVRITWGGRSFVLKRYVEPSYRHAAKQLLTRSRARATWNISHLLADAGVLTPRPVACVENTVGPLQLDSYLMYPFVAGETVKQYLQSQREPRQPLADLLTQCDALWERLRSLDVSLADANTGNFIVSSDRELWVIDLDKTRQHWSRHLAESRRRRTWQQLTAGMYRAAQIDIVRTGTGLRRAA